MLEGRGRATIGGETCELAPGTGAFVARGTAWSVDDADGLLVLSVLVEDPLADGRDARRDRHAASAASRRPAARSTSSRTPTTAARR